ncbi:MAG TPA: hypothetical protein VK348_01960 [Planctomycetota bacterium]|nr:hypothetical protein [Planctomycetota bacterium]
MTSPESATSTSVSCPPVTTTSTEAGYQGVVEIVTEIAEHQRITAPLGAFDTVRLALTTRSNDTRPRQAEERLELW